MVRAMRRRTSFLSLSSTSGIKVAEAESDSEVETGRKDFILQLRRERQRVRIGR